MVTQKFTSWLKAYNNTDLCYKMKLLVSNDHHPPEFCTNLNHIIADSVKMMRYYYYYTCIYLDVC